MKTARSLDCVRMKNEIQARLRRERGGMTDEAVARAIRRKLATSKTPIGRLWRSLDRRGSAAPCAAGASVKH